MDTGKRILWIDILKFFCIFSVMIEHTELGKSFGLFEYLHIPFGLAGFLFASGYVYNHKSDFKLLITKKIKQLLIPWFSWCFLIKLAILIINRDLSKFLNDCYWFLLQIRGVKDAMWFIFAIFIAYIPFYFLVNSFEKSKLANKKRVYMTLTAALLLVYETYIVYFPKNIFPWNTNTLPWHIEYIPFALFFMFLGYIYKKDGIALINKTNLLYGIFYVAIIIVVYYTTSNLSGIFLIIYNIITKILAICIIVTVSKKIKHNKIMLFVGQNTIIYYGLHNKIFEPLQIVFHRFIPSVYNYILTSGVLSAIFSIIVGIFMCVVIIIPTILINKYLPFLAGKPIKNFNCK